VIVFLYAPAVLAEEPALPARQAGAGEFPVPFPQFLRPAQNSEEVTTVVEILFLITVLSIAPALLVLTTAFTRIVVVLAFLRRALATQQLPPDQVMMGLSLFLTFMVMAPVWEEINREAIQPYLREESPISKEEAFAKAVTPVRAFMVHQMRRNRFEELVLFLDMTHQPIPEGGFTSPDEIPLLTLIPAYVLSELKIAFEMGFLLYLPFLVIDMVVASVLMSMGMLMLPPVVISLPFKVLLFALGDGWRLVVGGLVESFQY
jgi:flagellar biosynthetic protein FliP